jgi:hypothetical protein
MARGNSHELFTFIGVTIRAVFKLVAILAVLTFAACNTTSKDTARDRFAEYQAKRAARLAELEPKYGKCIADGWQSFSVIGKTTSTELVRQLRACDTDFDTSREVSATSEHFFVHVGTNRMWYFVNGVLKSYRT